jgi:hypothetical protein
MFSVHQKRQISDAVQKILRDTGQPEGEIESELRVWAVIKNNGRVPNPDVNPHNEAQDPTSGVKQ